MTNDKVPKRMGMSRRLPLGFLMIGLILVFIILVLWVLYTSRPTVDEVFDLVVSDEFYVEYEVVDHESTGIIPKALGSYVEYYKLEIAEDDFPQVLDVVSESWIRQPPATIPELENKTFFERKIIIYERSISVVAIVEARSRVIEFHINSKM